MNSLEYEDVIKICLLGGGSVGKRTLEKYMQHRFNENYRRTIGVDIAAIVSSVFIL